MYNYYDSSGFIAVIYFPVVIIMGSFFLLNLFLAVIMQSFSEQTRLQKEEENRRKAQKYRRQNMFIEKKLQMETTLLAIEVLNIGNAQVKDQALRNMLRVTKKKAELVRNGVNNIGDAALMYLDQ